MSGETSPREKWVFTKDKALTFSDQTHISDFPAWHVHSPACVVQLEHMVSVGRRATELLRKEVWTLGVLLPIAL